MMGAILFALRLASSIPAETASEAGQRPTITFVLGADEDPSLPMFRLAETHFRRDPSERTDQVVTSLRSLEEVRQHLASAPRPGGRPWGLVNLVVHGNASGYLDLALEPGGSKVNAGALARSAAHPGHAPLADEVLDDSSEVRIHGCAVGRDPRLLDSLSLWLGGRDLKRPRVRATRWYTSWRPAPGVASLPTRALCEFWDIVFAGGTRRPDRKSLTSLLGRALRSGLSLDEALSSRSLPCEGGAYSYEAPVRTTWTLVFAGAVAPPAAPPTGAAMARWLLAQDAFRSHLRLNGIAFHQLTWRVEPSERTIDGQTYPALTAVGEGRVLHVLRHLTRRPGEAGPEPQAAWEDPRYYASSR